MNRVINGSRYDTDTARQLGCSASNCLRSDLSWWEETLYRTKAGKYFIFGEGGPMTRYAKSLGDGSYGYGQSITPVSEEKAREWAENHLDGDSVDRIFGAIAESTARISVFLPAELVERMDAKCDALHASRAEIIADALRKYL